MTAAVQTEPVTVALVLELGNQLVAQHLGSRWTFRVGQAKTQFGSCSYRHKRITVSGPLAVLNSVEELTDTILHEIAHGITDRDHPKAAPHGEEWQAAAAAVGARPERAYDSTQVVTPQRQFVGTCPGCQRTVEKHKRTRIACGACCKAHNGGKFSADYLFVWHRR